MPEMVNEMGTQAAFVEAISRIIQPGEMIAPILSENGRVQAGERYGRRRLKTTLDIFMLRR